MDKIYAHERPERHATVRGDCAKAAETLPFSRLKEQQCFRNFHIPEEESFFAR
ncbi:hypothetical protein P7K49_001897, partial [Saguinus oedipus]